MVFKQLLYPLPAPKKPVALGDPSELLKLKELGVDGRFGEGVYLWGDGEPWLCWPVMNTA